METTEISKTQTSNEEKYLNNDMEIQVQIQSLPRAKYWVGDDLYKFQGFWIPTIAIPGIIKFQTQFQARDSDLLVTSFPKCGTTWLKSLVFMISNRSIYSISDNPLTKLSPHDVVPNLEFNVYLFKPYPDLEILPNPRIFSTHAPYPLLPSSVINSESKIVYMCRNLLDQFVSFWHFKDRLKQQGACTSISEAFEMFYSGVDGFGPSWEHVLSYWKASLENPNKVLFLKYEDMKENPTFYVKKLGDFLGFPFSEEEVKQGMIEEIANFCSFENLRNLGVNKSGKRAIARPIENNAYFRKGEVGDWANYLSPSMAERAIKLMDDKFSGSGLSFKVSSHVQNEHM
ncbi:Sulfotransferase domain [Dillenia turbinata]|uniref:Sulfotransferase n=1 Tax=Dillenia turbinata TaxID=194707 RepID=A0AAN8UUX4_9MAGN